MSSKEQALQAIRDLPEDVTMEGIEERIQFLAAIEKARQEVKRSEVVTHKEVQQLLREWTTK
jgi:hypothetical protein